MHKKIIVMLLFVVLAGTACSHVTPDPGKEGIDQARIEKDELKDRMKNDHKQKSQTASTDDHYVGSGVKFKMQEKDKLPSLFQKEITIVDKPLYLYELANKISELANVPVRISPSLRKAQVEIEEDDEGADESYEASYDPFEDEDPEKESKQIISLAGDSLYKVGLSFEGPLEDLLDKIATHYGIFWTYDKGRIEFKEVKTKTFSISTNIGNVSSESVMSNTSDGGSKGSGEGRESAKNEEKQETKVDYEYTIMEEIEKTIDNMLSEKGKASISVGSGTVQVTDVPSVVDQVEDYIEQTNSRLSRQVALSIKVFSLTSDELSNINFDLNAAFEDLDGEVAARLNPISPSNTSSGMGDLSAMILDTASESKPALGQWSGSEAFLKAINRMGDVSLVTSGSGVILNNQTYPIQNLKRTAYLAETEITLSDDGEDAASLTPGEVTTGFSMTATPHIMPNNEVFLQYNISLSSIDELREFTSHGATIQIPEVSSRSFMQRVKMGLGSTLILAGFERTENEKSNEKGLFGLMGQSDNSSKNKDIIIITMTINDLG